MKYLAFCKINEEESVFVFNRAEEVRDYFVESGKVMHEYVSSYVDSKNCVRLIFSNGDRCDFWSESVVDEAVAFDLIHENIYKKREVRRFKNYEDALNYARKLASKYGCSSTQQQEIFNDWCYYDEAKTRVVVHLKIELVLLSEKTEKDTSDFELLNINESASRDEIKKAYRKLVKENHPDKGGDSKKFEAIQKAYDRVLKNASKTKIVKVVAERFAVMNCLKFFMDYDSNNTRVQLNEVARISRNNAVMFLSGMLLAMFGAALLLCVDFFEFSIVKVFSLLLILVGAGIILFKIR